MSTKTRPEYYAVAAGRSVGIYTSKSTVMKYTLGYPNAEWKKFSSVEEGLDYLSSKGINDSALEKIKREYAKQSTSVSSKSKSSYMNLYVYCIGCGAGHVTIGACIYSNRVSNVEPEFTISDVIDDENITDNTFAEVYAILRAVETCPEYVHLHIYTNISDIFHNTRDMSKYIDMMTIPRHQTWDISPLSSAPVVRQNLVHTLCPLPRETKINEVKYR